MKKVGLFPPMALILALLLPLSLSAQIQIPTLNPPAPVIDSQHSFVKDFLKEHAGLWTSPAHIKTSDMKWIAPLGIGAAALLATDHKISNDVRDVSGLRGPSKLLSNFGGGLPMGAASGAMFAAGKWTGNPKMATTGSLALQAVLHTELVVDGLKFLTDRERPNKIGGDGKFFGGGKSFPSGHAATTFAFATVVADRYRDKPLVGVGAYGLATAVSLSRVGGLNHFPSDVLIGGTIGYLVGKYVIHHHPSDAAVLP